MKKPKNTKINKGFEEYKLYFTPKKDDYLYLIFKTIEIPFPTHEAQFQTDCNSNSIPIIIMNFPKINISTLGHECLHAVFWYFRKNKWELPSQSLNEKDEEKFNHIFSYLFEQAICIAPNLNKRHEQKDRLNKDELFKRVSKVYNFTY